MSTFYVRHFLVQSVHRNDGIFQVLLVPIDPQSQELIHFNTTCVGFREGEECRIEVRRVEYASDAQRR